jgi:hypothetical protein
MFLSLSNQVAHVDGAVLADIDCLHLHAGHLRGRWVGAVRRHWDQTDVAVSFSFGLKVRLDGTQTGILSLSSTARAYIISTLVQIIMLKVQQTHLLGWKEILS